MTPPVERGVRVLQAADSLRASSVRQLAFPLFVAVAPSDSRLRARGIGLQRRGRAGVFPHGPVAALTRPSLRPNYARKFCILAPPMSLHCLALFGEAYSELF
jgi:hypothetical protein